MNHPLRRNSMGRILVELLVIAVLPTDSTWTFINAARAAESLERLPYNHPGLHVDLGVGLWAWPVPCDADGDGDFDLIVSCPDKPSNGVWFFENATGDMANNKFPVFRMTANRW